MTRSLYPDAPAGSWISEEGWLVIGEEAWTSSEWASRVSTRPTAVVSGRPVRYDDDRHRKAREKKRRYYARKRAVA